MKNLEDFLTLIDSGLHTLLSEMLQHCLDTKMRYNGAINLRKDFFRVAHYRQYNTSCHFTGKAIQCWFSFFCSDVDNGNQFAPFKVIITFASVLNYVFGTCGSDER